MPRIEFCYDMGFIVDPRPPRGIEIQRGGALPTGCTPIVGLNVSGLLLTADGTTGERFQIRIDYSQVVEAVIRLIIEKHDAAVLLIPHVFCADRENDVDAILSTYERLQPEYTGRLFRITGSYDQHEVKSIIGLCEFFIGSRMHACIAALSQSIPTVAIAYSGKFAGVLGSIRADGADVVDLRNASLEQVLATIDRAYVCRVASSKSLSNAMPAIRSTVLGMLRERHGASLVSMDVQNATV